MAIRITHPDPTSADPDYMRCMKDWSLLFLNALGFCLINGGCIAVLKARSAAYDADTSTSSVIRLGLSS